MFFVFIYVAIILICIPVQNVNIFVGLLSYSKELFYFIFVQKHNWKNTQTLRAHSPVFSAQSHTNATKNLWYYGNWIERARINYRCYSFQWQLRSKPTRCRKWPEDLSETSHLCKNYLNNSNLKKAILHVHRKRSIDS